MYKMTEDAEKNISLYENVHEGIGRAIFDKTVAADGNYSVIHHTDNDGFFGAHILYALAGMTDTSRYFKCNYAHYEIDPDLIFDGDFVIVVDYNLNMDILRKILKKSSHVLFTDHHKTTGNMIKENKKEIDEMAESGKLSVIYNANQCGAKIIAQLFYKSVQIKQEQDTIALCCLVDLIDVYDRNSDPSIKKAWYLNSYTFKCARTEVGSPMWDRLMNSQEFLTEAIIAGKKIYDATAVLDEVTYNVFSREVVFHGLKCRVKYGYGNGYSFNEHMYEYDAVILYHKIPDGRFKYSIFSDTGSDIETIAKLYGGGGHAGAAGFTSNRDLFGL